MFRMKWFAAPVLAASIMSLAAADDSAPQVSAPRNAATAGASPATAPTGATAAVTFPARRIDTTPDQDVLFLALREAARRDDAQKAVDLAASLGDFPIRSYVEYFSLKPRIRTAPESEIRDFLTRYDGEAIADRLRNDWLLELGRTGNWTLFDEQYPRFILNDDPQLKCYALLSRASKGQNVADDARALLTNPKAYGDACPALIGTLIQNGQFGAEDLWFQIRLAAEAGASGFLRRAAAIGGISDHLLKQAMDVPAKTIARGIGGSSITHQIFIVALGRVARSDPGQAAFALKHAKGLTREEQKQAWAQIAMQAALKLSPDAIEYWRKADDAALWPDAYQWRVRSALRESNWKLMHQWIDAMPADLRSDPTWVYWLGRALKATGNREDAELKFRSIAGQPHFYGQLASEELGQSITIPPRAAPPTPEEIAPMAANEGFARALKFFDLNMRWEGYREWNWQLRKMTDRQFLAAAEFARQNNVLDRMVNTSDRTKEQFDFTQRFPAPYANLMRDATKAAGIDEAWAYGLIRQESRFVHIARSSVGASGLMQLMPSTAKEVARRIGLTDYHPGRINDIATNILLGTNYLSMVLNALDGSQALATAAYNAGPARPRSWRATLSQPVEGAIFAETIPFNETRAYVKNVLSNATYYAALFDNKPQSLKKRLGIVTPFGGPVEDSREPF